MISQTAEYALRAMVFLAARGTAATGHEIAGKTMVPPGYLSKIMQQLGKGKLVLSRRGIGGGFVLARQPADISILDVINAVDRIEKLHTCPLGIVSHGFNLCPLHKRLSQATENLETAFAQSSLSELLEESKHPLCQSIPLQAEPGS